MKALASSFILAVFFPILSACVGPPPSNPNTASSREFPPLEIDYELIPESVDPPDVGWADDVDFGELRNLYGRRRDYSARCERHEEKAIAAKAVEAADAAKTIELTESLLSRCPIDPLLHHWVSSALMSLGLESEAEVHRRWVVGLLDSILETGDGKTKQTPFVTISIGEEYAVLSYLGLTRKQQSMIDGPVTLDMILAETAEGEKRTVYFNPALHFVRLMMMFE